MDYYLFMSQSSRVRRLSSSYQARVGILAGSLGRFYVEGFSYSRYVGYSEYQLYGASYVEGLGLAFLDGSYYCGVLYYVAYYVDYEAICLYAILSKRDATAIADRSAMDIGSSLASYRSTISI